MIRAAGHNVRYQSIKDKKWKKALKKNCDIVAVAGGDGSVGKVARRLVGSRTPIAVLPMGTANNIAKTLGIKGRGLEDLVAGWSSARGVNFDAGVAKGPWGSQYFIEGFGIGLFAEAMSRLDGKDNADLADSGKPTEVIRSVLGILKKELRRCEAKKLAVRLDGEDLSGRYVILEALNIRYIGPNLNLAPRAEINDGYLDVVFVAEREGAALGRYFADFAKRKRRRPNLAIRRGRHLQVEWESSPIHMDDNPWPDKDEEEIAVRSNAIDIRIEPAALVFLLPKPRRNAR